MKGSCLELTSEEMRRFYVGIVSLLSEQRTHQPTLPLFFATHLLRYSMMLSPQSLILAVLAIATYSASAFVSVVTAPYSYRAYSTQLQMAEEGKAAPMVSGEELEAMLQEWETPLVVDAYATWCGPCLLMAPEFENAAQDLSGKVRFVKLDTDLEPQMAGRLGIMGLPTLLFLDKNDDNEAVEQGKAPVAVLKERIEGALRKESIVDLCNYHFFGGPIPSQLS
jgi:thioredoxin